MDTITSRDNKRLKAVRRLFEDKHFRRETGCFVTEGLRLTAEAVRLGMTPLSLFVGDRAIERCGDEVDSLIASAEAAFHLPDHLMDTLGDTVSPQGVVGVFAAPLLPPAPLTGCALMLCHLQEPGNVGSILRTAAAFCLPVVLTPDCPGPFSPKVLRASMGGALGGRVSVVDSAFGYLAQRREAGSPIVATVLAEDSRRLGDTDLSDALVLLGNEGAGLSDLLVEYADSGLYIPISSSVESLGVAVAAGIVAYTMHAQRRAEV